MIGAEVWAKRTVRPSPSRSFSSENVLAKLASACSRCPPICADHFASCQRHVRLPRPESLSSSSLRAKRFVASEVSSSTAVDHLAGEPWPPLPRDLPPGDETTIDLELRRPLGRTRLRVEPHVLGVAGATALHGPSWEAEL